jgi:hypothetical protein
LPDFEGIKIEDLEPADVILERVKRKAEGSPENYFGSLAAINA